MGEVAANSKPDSDPRLVLPGILERVVLARDALPTKLLWTVIGIARAHECLDAIEPLLDSIQARDGDTLRLVDERARFAFAKKEYDAALLILADRYERSPSATAAISIARLNLETGTSAEAKRISDELNHTHPDLVTVQQLAADVARATGRFELARSYYLGLVDNRPEHPSSLLALARIAIDEGDPDSAGAFFRRALAASAESLTPNQATLAAEIATDLGDLEKAETLRSDADAVQMARLTASLTEIETALAGIGDIVSASAPAPRNVSPSPAPLKSGPRLHAKAINDTNGVTEQDDPRVTALLREEFGHESLRPGQSAVITNVMAGNDTLAIMPTGAGKSLTFQLPAMLDDRTTVVVSPLIALMKDQVDSLPDSVRSRTALINSTLSSDEMRERLQQLSRRELKLVYVAPERLRNYGFLRALRDAGVSRMVVDEAHCISMWGHDFRPDYLFIPRAVAELGDPPILAITATATPGMVDQIAAGLDRQMDVVRTSIFRENLKYEVHHLSGKEAKLERVMEICRHERGAGIVYVSSRKDTESIAKSLNDRGVHAVPYHAGLDQNVRAQNQDLFMTGRVRVVVATIAFGMGINKADVRFIIHVVAPRSLEAYAQESGRAGRDGAPSRCVLLVSNHDRTQLVMNARRDEMDLPALRRVYAQLMRQARGSWVIAEPSFLRATGDQDNEPDPRVALGVLEQAKLICRQPDAPISYDLRWIASEVTRIDPSLAQDWAKLEQCLPSGWGGRNCTIWTADVSGQSGLAPVEIDRVLQAHPSLLIREGQRCMCLHLEHITGDATGTLQSLLNRARRDAEKRINIVMDYANGKLCRHASIASHLGERLEPCRIACDICAGSADLPLHRTTASTSKAPITAESAFAVLEALRTIPFSVGRTGLVRLLMGSVESRIRADRSRSFGVLKDVPKGRVETLIEQMIEQGFIDRDTEGEYRLLSLTRKGASATTADLDSFASKRAVAAIPDNVDPESPEGNLYARLAEWRRSKAVEESVPAYVVAQNSMLLNMAVSRPRTKTALMSVPGFGSARVEKYGTEILSVIDESSS